ncbi:uncharacterized protein LOC128236003 [Mya arenaria]|uniref:uncharacterized protein LOC128210602 n=2 Tax=Mya arenaria TaxID=6604 RepID=UPI0022E8B98C|nr:uncharacterized protein LOC128210602 [Mya arenaria]XP_052806745.1 uncharacterized protein LOC128236003 [Mya arenaria]
MRKQTTKWCLIEGENSEKQQVWRSVFKRNMSEDQSSKIGLLGPPLNKEILEIWEKYSQPAAVRKIQEEFEVLRSSPESCLRVKMFRLSQKCQKLRKQKRDGELRSILQSGFHAPEKKITEDVTLADESQIRQVQDAARKVVQENHKLKREIEHVEDTNENLSFQIEHYGKKLDIQMKLLDMMNGRYGEAMKYKRESHNLQHELELWQQKFQHISDQLDKTTNEISMLHEKVKKNSIRNLNKKIKTQRESHTN